MTARRPPRDGGSRFGYGPLTRAALDFADQRHGAQRRRTDGAPFVLHPFEVGRLLQEAGCSDAVIAAGVLHEVLEDTDTDRAELERRFGAEVASLVAGVSDDPAIADPAERKAALRRQVAHIGGDTALVFAADKISKARELRAYRPGGGFDDEETIRLDHYAQSLVLLDELLPGNPLVDQLRTEVDALCPLA